MLSVFAATCLTKTHPELQFLTLSHRPFLSKFNMSVSEGVKGWFCQRHTQPLQPDVLSAFNVRGYSRHKSLFAVHMTIRRIGPAIGALTQTTGELIFVCQRITQR